MHWIMIAMVMTTRPQMFDPCGKRNEAGSMKTADKKENKSNCSSVQTPNNWHDMTCRDMTGDMTWHDIQWHDMGRTSMNEWNEWTWIDQCHPELQSCQGPPYENHHHLCHLQCHLQHLSKKSKADSNLISKQWLTIQQTRKDETEILPVVSVKTTCVKQK